MLRLLLSCCAAPAPETTILSPIRNLATLEHAADHAREVRVFVRQSQKRTRVRGLLLVGKHCLSAKIRLARGAAHELDAALLQVDHEKDIRAAFSQAAAHQHKAVIFLSDISYKSESFNQLIQQCITGQATVVIAAADSLSSVPLAVRSLFQFRVFLKRDSGNENIF